MQKSEVTEYETQEKRDEGSRTLFTSKVNASPLIFYSLGNFGSFMICPGRFQTIAEDMPNKAISRFQKELSS